MQRGASELDFEELWRSVVERPVTDVEVGEGEVDVLSAETLAAWLTRVADRCLADGLISVDDRAELKTCVEGLSRVLGAVPPEKLRATLVEVAETES